jgi:hypothetical protein
VHVLHITYLSTVRVSKWGEMGPMLPISPYMGPISGMATHENLRNKLNTIPGIQFVHRNIRFDKFIKSVNRLLVEY